MSDERPTPETNASKAPRRSRFGYIPVAIVTLGGVLGLAGYTLLFRSVPLRISKETTYITEPLKSDGKQVDYFVAWEQETYPENIATEDNGYRLIVQHLGKGPETTPATFAQLCEKLGLDAGSIQPDMTFSDPHEFLVAYVESDEFDETLVEGLLENEDPEPEAEDEPQIDPELLRKLQEQLGVSQWPDESPDFEAKQALQERLASAWTLDDLPMMEAWLAENGPALDLIGEAVRKSTFHVPFTRESEDSQLIEFLMPEVQRMRSFARALSARANYRIAVGDIDGAIEDIAACKRLGRHVGPGGCITQMLIGIAIEGIANMVGIAGSLEHPPTREQIERLVDQLNGLPAQAELEKALLFERYQVLEVVQTIATGNGTMEALGQPGKMPTRFALDWNIVTRRLNEYFDMVATAGEFPIPSWSYMAIISVRARSETMADLFAAIMLPAAKSVHEACRRRTCFERMHHISLAMLLYERDHDTLPLAFTTDTDGNPLHSWRVLLLPYLGQQKLYDKIRLDEPWDSEHNRQFHQEAVPFYQCPSKELAAGLTTYSVVVGPDMPFEADQGKLLSRFSPNSANMILVVEVPEAGCWMDPTHNVSLAAAEKGINGYLGGGAAIGSQHPGGANVGFRDGSIRFISETIDSRLLKELLRGMASRMP